MHKAPTAPTDSARSFGSLAPLVRSVREHPYLFLGFTLFWLWVIVTLQGPIRFPLGSPFGLAIPSWGLSLVVLGATLAGGALMHGRIEGASPRRRWWLFVTITLFAGLLLSTAWVVVATGESAAPFSLDMAIYVLGSVLMGVGAGGVLCEFCHLYARLGALTVLCHGAAALLACTCWQFLITILALPVLNMVLNPLVPLVILWCFHKSAPSVLRRSQRTTSTAGIRVPAKLLVTTATQGLAFGIGLGLLIQWSDLFAEPRLVGSLCAGLAGLLLIVSALLVKADYTQMIYLIGFPLGSLGFLMMACFPDAIALGNALQAVGACFMYIAILSLSVHVARSTGASVIYVAGFCMACLCFGQVVGGCLGSALGTDSFSPLPFTGISAVMSVAMLLIALYVSNGGRIEEAWENVRPGDLVPDVCQRKVNELAAAHGLTPRESQVLECVAMGMGRRAASEELGVSEETVKTHLRNIYTKLDLHSQEELGRAVWGTGRRDGSSL